MAEKVIPQRKVAAPDVEHAAGKSMNPPAFQLKAGKDAAAGQVAETIQKKDAKAEKKSEAQKVSQNEGYKSYKSSHSIVTVPDGAGADLPIVMVFGGKSYANKEWMMKQVPAHLFATHIFAFANYTTAYGSVKPDIEAAMGTSQVKGSYKALLGFSAGGYPLEAAKGSESWSILGMIDAVVYKDHTYPAKVLQIYNIWSGLTEKDDPRHLLHQRIQKGEVAGESFRDRTHETMPSKWFNCWGGML